MIDETKRCDNCAWPLDCCPEQQTGQLLAADCPRVPDVWDRRLAEHQWSMQIVTPLEEMAEAEETELVVA